MPEMSVYDLWPGVAVFSAEVVARYHSLLAAGQSLPPVEVYQIGECKIVRDGNNRVRAYIDHCRVTSTPFGSIECVPSTAKTPGPAALEGLRKMSGHYGCGPEAFARMPLAGHGEYEAVQTAVAREIFCKEP